MVNNIIKKNENNNIKSNKSKKMDKKVKIIKKDNKNNFIEKKQRNKQTNKQTEIKETKKETAKNVLKNKTTKKSTTKNIKKSEINDYNTYLFHQGNNYESYDIMGSHVRTLNRKKGVQFATWAPNAKAVYVVGDFNNFEIIEKYKLEKVTDNGIWKGFFTEIKIGSKYKYCIIDSQGNAGEYKSDPYSIKNELRPNNASIIYTPKSFRWSDTKWIKNRNSKNVLEEPLNIYEIHLGSWKRKENGDFLSYEEMSEELPEYLKEMNYTHVEFMPIMEHPLDESWGYQITGFFSPTSRFGDLEGLKLLINKLHASNIGVILDWTPAHFCKDAQGLYKFSGSATYEYQEEWKADNKDWGTYNFDLGRPEVKSFLISNALYWFRNFHVDGLRVDAVSSMLYLDYSRNDGEWVPNIYDGNGNLESIQFLKELNKAVFKEFPSALMIAEESTTWPNVTKPIEFDGLGFNLKWNMGWMNDTLEYIELNQEYRKYHHKNITFAMMYNHAENYVLPVSHDEVVHGKKSLFKKISGDEWNKFAGLRAFMAYMIGHPGKKLTFMGCELAQDVEWRDYEQLKWDLLNNYYNKKTQLFVKDLNNLYIENKALWELDYDSKGFNWIEADNSEQSIVIFTRHDNNEKDTLLFLVNFKSDVYYDYQIGVPYYAKYEEILNTDSEKYGGSNQVIENILIAEKIPFQGQDFSIKIKVPPMATLILKVNEMLVEENNNLLDNEN